MTPRERDRLRRDLIDFAESIGANSSEEDLRRLRNAVRATDGVRVPWGVQDRAELAVRIAGALLEAYRSDAADGERLLATLLDLVASSCDEPALATDRAWRFVDDHVRAIARRGRAGAKPRRGAQAICALLAIRTGAFGEPADPTFVPATSDAKKRLRKVAKKFDGAVRRDDREEQRRTRRAREPRV